MLCYPKLVSTHNQRLSQLRDTIHSRSEVRLTTRKVVFLHAVQPLRVQSTKSHCYSKSSTYSAPALPGPQNHVSPIYQSVHLEYPRSESGSTNQSPGLAYQLMCVNNNRAEPSRATFFFLHSWLLNCSARCVTPEQGPSYSCEIMESYIMTAPGVGC